MYGSDGAREGTPSFSIVVPTYGRPTQLKECLQGLARLNYPKKSLEIIVVDDGTPISYKRIVRPFEKDINVVLHRQSHAGPATARNKGASLARGDFLAFIDDDCVPDPEWIMALSDCLGQEKEAIAGGLTKNVAPNPCSIATQILTDYLRDHYHRRGAPMFTSSNLAVSAKNFAKLGGFSTAFPLAAGEDREFCRRALHRGLHLAFCPQAVVLHKHRLNIERFWNQHFMYGQGAFLYHRAVRSKGGVGGLGESPIFYLKLLVAPFTTHNRQPFLMFTLLVISQAANALGYFKQYRRSDKSTRQGSEPCEVT